MAIALFVIGILLIVFNISAVKKEKKSFTGTLSHAEENMKEFEVEIGRLRREFTETIIELQSEIAELKMRNEYEENDINPQELVEVDEELSNGNSIKINEISKFLEQNMSVDDIAEKLGIGKGEVLLIKELYLK